MFIMIETWTIVNNNQVGNTVVRIQLLHGPPVTASVVGDQLSMATEDQLPDGLPVTASVVGDQLFTMDSLDVNSVGFLLLLIVLSILLMPILETCTMLLPYSHSHLHSCFLIS